MLDNYNVQNLNLINNVNLLNFRNHISLNLEANSSIIIIDGKNGSGKTSILEAISTFSYGKGIRSAKNIEMVNKDKNEFSIELKLQIDRTMPTYLKSYFNKTDQIKKIWYNDKELIKLTKLKKSMPMLWIVPYTEKIFNGAASLRRKFLDKIICNFDENHNSRIIEYEKLLRQRTKLLKNKSYDDNWLSSIEKLLSKLSVAICSSRLEILNRLKEFLEITPKRFPNVELSFADSIENLLSKTPAIDIENKVEKDYKGSRSIDSIIGGSKVGCQTTDIIFMNKNKDLSASMCSSGEQKAILITFILATSKALLHYIKKPPIILLDEIFTHLDKPRKESLFNELKKLGSQTWITITENEDFLKDSSNICYFNLNSKVNM